MIDQFLNDPDYIVTEDGKIFTIKTRSGNRSVKNELREIIRITKTGYAEVCYFKKHLLVHRIVYQKYVGKLDPQLVINHIDGNKLNNHPSNLEQVSVADNNLHGYRVLNRAAVLGNKKITKDIADKIREDYLTKNYTYQALACKYGLKSKGSIAGIISGKNW